MDRVEQGKDICETFDQLINTDDEFLNNKTKLYCEYCLSLDKEYVDRIRDDFYEECENYFKKFSSNEEKEKQFIKSYESNLAVEGKEICKEVDTIGVNNELTVKKAVVYCQFISGQKDVDPMLVDRCQNYIDDVNNFYSYKFTFDKVNNERRKKEAWLDMRNMRLKGR